MAKPTMIELAKRKIDHINDDDYYRFLRREWGNFNFHRNIQTKYEDYHFGAFERGNLVGVAGITILDDTCIFEDLIINDKKRGSGFGKALLERVEEKSREEECRQIIGHTSDIHSVAKDFYLKYGFEIVATLPNWKYNVTWYDIRKFLQ